MKKTAASSRSDRQSPMLRGVLPALCVVLAAFAFVSQPPRELLHGFWQILISDAGLITDPAVTGGAGAALLNAALVLALSTALVYAMHLPVTGLTFACLFMMAGFSLLGKNLLNILPVLLGGWLYAIVFAGLYLWQGWKLGAAAYLAIAAAVTLAVTALLLRWLKTKGAQRFAML